MSLSPEQLAIRPEYREARRESLREARSVQHTPLVTHLRHMIRLHGRYATLRQCVNNGLPIAYTLAAFALQH